MVNADTWWDSLVRDRFRWILELVLDAVSDDYVTVEIVVKNINEWDEGSRPETWEARRAAPLTRPEVVRALKELTREGFVQSYVFNGPDAHPMEFDSAKLGELWFYPTKRGMKAVSEFPGKD